VNLLAIGCQRRETFRQCRRRRGHGTGGGQAGMSSAQQVIAGRPPAADKGPLSAGRRSPRKGVEFAWAIAFVTPYLAVFVAFAVVPTLYALWIAAKPALYAELLDDPRYLGVLVNTLLFVAVAVNVKMFLALLLSGFFMRRRRWIRALLVIYMLPWVLASVQAFISIHWILIGDMGLVNRLLQELFGIEGPIWFNHYWLALGANIAAHIWKWMPFWTVIFLAGRLTIPQDLYDAAELDGATGWRRFVHVTFPLLANLYLVCTLLSAIWTIGDFNTVYFVSVGAPTKSTDVLATLGFEYTFDGIKQDLGLAAVLSALPVLIPLVLILIRRVQLREVQL
jgi:multiple sugar transport system permease protein